MRRPIFGDPEDPCEIEMGLLRQYIQDQLGPDSVRDFMIEPSESHRKSIQLEKGDVIVWSWTSSNQV